MPERRYNEEEIEAIFARASEVERDTARPLQLAEGRTLAELQDIGKEAGLSADAIAQAARLVDQPPPPAPARFLGLPLAVGRTVMLNRRLTDGEWERLVVQLRETFNARGVMRNEGSLRSWSNGNLQVLLEPDGEGQRVRFKTLNGQSRSLMVMGLGLVGISVLTFVTGMLAPTGGSVGQVFSPLALMGAASFALGALRLPGWARTRQQQMDDLSARLTSLPPEPDRA